MADKFSVQQSNVKKVKMKHGRREVRKTETPCCIILYNTLFYYQADLEEFHKQCAMKKLKFAVFLASGRLMCVSESFNGSTE